LRFPTPIPPSWLRNIGVARNVHIPLQRVDGTILRSDNRPGFRIPYVSGLSLRPGTSQRPWASHPSIPNNHNLGATEGLCGDNSRHLRLHVPSSYSASYSVSNRGLCIHRCPGMHKNHWMHGSTGLNSQHRGTVDRWEGQGGKTFRALESSKKPGLELRRKISESNIECDGHRATRMRG
jgi:hypothetical protein